MSQPATISATREWRTPIGNITVGANRPLHFGDHYKLPRTPGFTAVAYGYTDHGIIECHRALRVWAARQKALRFLRKLQKEMPS